MKPLIPSGKNTDCDKFLKLSNATIQVYFSANEEMR
jgi:hypothetical protein